jgi:glycosyltransferase involved in cell wall biosynthesis
VDDTKKNEGGTVVLVPRLPHPPVGGADLRNWQTVLALASLGPVAVLGLGRPTDRPAVAGIVEWSAASATGPWDLAAAAPAELLAWLRSDGHPSERWFSEEIADELSGLVRRFQPRLVVVGHLWLHTYLAPLRELGCRIVLDAHNLEGPLHAELAGDHSDLLRGRFTEAAFEIEARAFASVDQVWACSAADARHARELYPAAAPIAVVPNAVDTDRLPRAEPPSGGPVLVYPAAFGYPPNRTAVRWLLDEIFPALLGARPDARLVLVGSEPTEDMLAAAAREPRIEVTGAVPDTAPFFGSATVVPVPLREGGGTRFKVLEALAAGVPVVSTAKGVEGLELSPGEDYLPAETTSEFVEAISGLAGDVSMRSAFAERGRTTVERRFSLAVAREAVRGAVAALADVNAQGR